jgi:hypothetical protein
MIYNHLRDWNNCKKKLICAICSTSLKM